METVIDDENRMESIHGCDSQSGSHTFQWRRFQPITAGGAFDLNSFLRYLRYLKYFQIQMFSFEYRTMWFEYSDIYIFWIYFEYNFDLFRYRRVTMRWMRSSAWKCLTQTVGCTLRMPFGSQYSGSSSPLRSSWRPVPVGRYPTAFCSSEFAVSLWLDGRFEQALRAFTLVCSLWGF